MFRYLILITFNRMKQLACSNLEAYNGDMVSITIILGVATREPLRRLYYNL